MLYSTPDLTVLSSGSWGIETPTSTPDPFKDMSLHCLAHGRITQGKLSNTDSCLWRRAEGDAGAEVARYGWTMKTVPAGRVGTGRSGRRGQAKMGEDLLHDGSIRNGGDQAQPAAAARTRQHVQPEGAMHENRPRLIARSTRPARLASRHIGADGRGEAEPR